MSIVMDPFPNTTSRQKDKGIDQVLVELNHFRHQTERLGIMNKLHGRMAGVLNVAAMIEAYSVWLMPHVEHELVGYQDKASSEKHLYCSGHGPKRRSIIAFAEVLLNSEGQRDQGYTSEEGYCAHKWLIETGEDAGFVIVVKGERGLSENQITLVNESLLILAEALRRGIEYEELYASARKDALTGLANRRVFDERINDMMLAVGRYKRPLTMASLDLDFFKQINDNFGHQKGDRVLRQVAGVFRNGIRSTDMLVRIGGDEFLLVMDNTNLSSGRILAERLCAAVSEMDIWADAHTKLGVSIGMSEWTGDEGLGEWMERVDDMLYRAKSNGRSQVYCG